jgi:hypothetical protein
LQPRRSDIRQRKPTERANARRVPSGVKAQSDVLQLSAGPGSFICNECVQLCVGIIANQNPDCLNRIANCLPLAAEAKRRELIETQNAAQAEYDRLAALFFPWSGP